MNENFNSEEFKLHIKSTFITSILMVLIYLIFKKFNILTFWSGYIYCIIGIFIYDNIKLILNKDE